MEVESGCAAGFQGRKRPRAEESRRPAKAGKDEMTGSPRSFQKELGLTP